jgi:tryptophan synthase alpha chain
MTGAQSIERAIRARPAQGEPALVAYLTAGFPSRERFLPDLAAISSEAHLVEVGVPFTDPMADGVTIQRASQAALAAGTTLSWILDELARRPHAGAPLLLMSYLNPLLAYGLQRLADAAVRARVAGIIVPDLPLEESAALRAALEEQGVALVQMVTPVTPPARLESLCRAATGFVYAVTMTGTTGKTVAAAEEVLAYLDRVRVTSPLPVCAGFGIRSREHVERLRGHVDGVVVGSALVEILERGADARAFLAHLKGPT